MLSLAACAKTELQDAAASTSLQESLAYEVSDFTDEYKLFAQNDYLEFFLNAATTEFFVKNKKDGEIYHSNPQDWSSNPAILDDAVKSEIASVFSLTYYNDAGNSFSMSAHRDSVILQQFKILTYPDDPCRVSVKYVVGDDTSDNILPVVITQETFEKYTLDSEGITKSERAEILKGYRLLNEKEISKIESQTNRDRIYQLYPHVNEMPIYEMRQTTNNNMKKRLKEHVQKTELTLELIEEDLARIEPFESSAKKPTFMVTIDYALDGPELVASIPSASYESPANFYLSNIQLLPYFNALSGDGIIFVPDGSGAVIDVSKPHAPEFSSLSLPLYGREIVKDMTVQSNTTGIISNFALFPVYGISSDRGGLFCVLEKGDAVASITANSASVGGYSKVYADFNVWPNDYLSFGTARLTAFSYIFPRRPISSDLRVRYMFLESVNSGYLGMAKVYQEYLSRSGFIKRLPEDEPYPLLIEFVGGVAKNQSVLGVMSDRVLPLTSYADALAITQDLLDSGVPESSLNIRYNAWSNKGYFNTSYESIRLDGSLGGKSGFGKLSGFLRDHGIGFYPDINLMYVGKDILFDGFGPSRNASRTIVSEIATTAMINPIRMASYTDRGKRYVLSPLHAGKVLRGSLEDAKDLNLTSVSLGEYGRQLQSDYKKKSLVTRAEALDLAIGNLDYARDSGFGILLEGAGAPFLPFADFIAKMPLSNSLFKATDYSVPFMQIVLHGYANYSGESRNLAADTQRGLLEAAEGGAGLSYTWIAAPDSILINTELADVFYSANYKNSWNDALLSFKKFYGTFSGLHARLIVNHEILADGLARTTYDNGSAVIVNFSGEERVVDGALVPANDFVFIEAIR
ncbi:MAG: DUF5696 domain-containing protein [Clostridiales bacterium]|nr:DUF5696 domain-containing protein [Clostridiales bacterium]